MAWGRRVCIFSFYDWGGAVGGGKLEREWLWALLGVQVALFWRGGRKLQSLMFATSGGFAQFDKLRENVWAIIHMSLSERCNLLPSSGGWFEERRGASRVVTNPTVWVRDRRVSIIDYCYRKSVSWIEFSSLMFATNGGFVQFNKLWCVLAQTNFLRVVCLPELTWVMPDGDCAMRSCWKSTTCYRAWLSGDKFLSLIFATSGGFVQFDKLLVERLFDFDLRRN